MIETLLQRKEELKEEFLDSKDKVSLARGWSKVVLTFQQTLGLDVTQDQLKSKYQALQKVYRTLNADDKKTGNGTPARKPFYWDVLVNHFGGRSGLSHDCVFSSDAVQNVVRLFDHFLLQSLVDNFPHRNQKCGLTHLILQHLKQRQVRSGAGHKALISLRDMKL